jgi:hypothetical protein
MNMHLQHFATKLIINFPLKWAARYRLDATLTKLVRVEVAGDDLLEASKAVEAAEDEADEETIVTDPKRPEMIARSSPCRMAKK